MTQQTATTLGKTPRGLPIHPVTHPSYTHLEKVRTVGADAPTLGKLAQQAHPGYRAVDHQEAADVHYSVGNFHAARAHQAASNGMAKSGELEVPLAAMVVGSTIAGRPIVAPWQSSCAEVYEGVDSDLTLDQARMAAMAIAPRSSAQDHLDCAIAYHALAEALLPDPRGELAAAAAFIHFAGAGHDPLPMVAPDAVIDGVPDVVDAPLVKADPSRVVGHTKGGRAVPEGPALTLPKGHSGSPLLHHGATVAAAHPDFGHGEHWDASHIHAGEARKYAVGSPEHTHHTSMANAHVYAIGHKKRSSMAKAAPGGTGKPRANHKYLSRERKGNEWVYTYPEDVKNGASSGAAPAEAPAAGKGYNPADPPADTPRAKAKAATAKKKADYAFARRSAIGNKGEDLLNSARHKRNAWRGLEAAEADGTAKASLTRKTLMEAEPVDLSDKVEGKSPYAGLVAHIALNKFPDHVEYRHDDTPEIEAKRRKQYVAAFDAVKAAIASISPDDSGREAVHKVTTAVSKEIRALRVDDRYNPLANQLAGYANRSLNGRASHAAWGAVGTVSWHHRNAGDAAAQTEKVRETVKQVMAGKSVDKALGASSGRTARPKGKDVDVSKLYESTAVRKGPEVAAANTRKGQENLLLKTMGLRGLQWGNSVPDAEREHHLKQTALALHDLADVTGLPLEMVSFNGRLGLAIGARGRAGARAHYEPSTKVINLTREGGAGSLAHEWGHFFDNILGSLTENGDHGYITNEADYSWKKDDSTPKGAMLEAVKGVINHPAMKAFQTRMRHSQEFRELAPSKRAYWGSTIEVWARSFEKHVRHQLASKGRENTYLSGIKPSVFWPNDEDAKELAPAFEAVFEAAKKHGFVAKAIAYLNQFVAEATGVDMVKGGKGSRGGVIVGFRPDGSPVYGSRRTRARVARVLAEGHPQKNTTNTEKSEGMITLSKAMGGKKTGEGSRGGKVVSHTKSGAPVYATLGHTSSGKPVNADSGYHSNSLDYNKKEHGEAADFHMAAADAISKKPMTDANKKRYNMHRIAHQLHMMHNRKMDKALTGLHESDPLHQMGSQFASKHPKFSAQDHMAAAEKHSKAGAPHLAIGHMLAASKLHTSAQKSMPVDILQEFVKSFAKPRAPGTIGTTQSGKHIHAPSSDGMFHRAKVKDYTHQDHMDAAAAHQTMADKGRAKWGKMVTGNSKPQNKNPMRGKLRDVADHHMRIAATHRQLAPQTSKSMDAAAVNGGWFRESVAMLTLSKAESGEGSRGGKIIGHTRSGKPIYSSQHESYHTKAGKDNQSAHEAMRVPGASSRTKTAHVMRHTHPDWTQEDHDDAKAAHGGRGLGAMGDAHAFASSVMGRRRALTDERMAVRARAKRVTEGKKTTEKSMAAYLLKNEHLLAEALGHAV